MKYLIIGLGNPGEEYTKTRHNAGFMAVDFVFEEFSKNLHIKTPWKMCKLTQSLRSTLKDKNHEIMFLKPQTYMNMSGVTVKKAISRFKIPLENTIVLHDDIDIVLGKVKYQKGRGDAGHNGIKSIIQYINTKDFVRIRIGILPENIDKKKLDTAKFVLNNFTQKEIKILSEKSFPQTVKYLYHFLKL